MSQWEEYRAAYGLTVKEAKLFAVMADGEMHSKQGLLDRIWGVGHAASSHLIPVHIDRLQKKIAPHGFEIEKVRLSGYRLFRSDGLRLPFHPHPASQENA